VINFSLIPSQGHKIVVLISPTGAKGFVGPIDFKLEK
jgi:hypothetical protein